MWLTTNALEKGWSWMNRTQELSAAGSGSFSSRTSPCV
jgi:hypothetical protein